MTWFPVYTKEHELLGVIWLQEDTTRQLIECGNAIIYGQQNAVAITAPFEPIVQTIEMQQIVLRLEKVTRSWPTGDPMRPYDHETLFHYITVDEQAYETLRREDLHWPEAPFVYCPDRKGHR